MREIRRSKSEGKKNETRLIQQQNLYSSEGNMQTEGDLDDFDSDRSNSLEKLEKANSGIESSVEIYHPKFKSIVLFMLAMSLVEFA